MSAAQPHGPRTPLGRLSGAGVGTLLAMTIGVLLVLAVLGIGLALIANGELTHNRNLLLDRVGPARRAALSLENALLDEETGVRGFVITANRSSLGPYREGRMEELKAYAQLRAEQAAVGPQLSDEVTAVQNRAEAWRTQFVAPALADPRATARSASDGSLEGKQQFDALRASLASLRDVLEARDTQARDALNSAADRLEVLLILAAVLILGGVLAAGFVLRRTITWPLSRLGSEARRVAGGEFDKPLQIAAGPREVAEVGAEIDAMRERIVAELASVEVAHAQLEEQARELTRSNAELEQFAYVASHDLQEPLRKIASFCQALKTRYEGQLDDRAEQYIDFAVDGAKRMQVLINDLLAFSRVGRSGREQEPVALAGAVAAAEVALADAIERNGARVLAGELPTVRGDRTQLVSLMQNLIANALKFRGPEPPVVRIAAGLSDGQWELSCADNGIGIEPDYAERIFLIFQRLHSRETYEGSGIGLALCRKIVEYHGGRIWLDSNYTDGACFRFTLPVMEGDAKGGLT
ncbi:MAG TPA: ATP-binding protein [Solirubrobacteraceae bacterium]|jgi:signal transduction histidine kinase|nr:ATP-binding protein [Solirubrobacteraceae bacterium]